MALPSTTWFTASKVYACLLCSSADSSSQNKYILNHSPMNKPLSVCLACRCHHLKGCWSFSRFISLLLVELIRPIISHRQLQLIQLSEDVWCFVEKFLHRWCRYNRLRMIIEIEKNRLNRRPTHFVKKSGSNGAWNRPIARIQSCTFHSFIFVVSRMTQS